MVPLKLAYSTNAYRRMTLDDALRHIAEIGYAGVELMADKPHLWPREVTNGEIEAVRRGLDETGLAISNVNAFMMTAVESFWHPSWIEPDVARRRLRLDHTIAALRVAQRLGAASITTEPGGPLPEGVTREEALDTFLAGLTEALRVAEEVGVQLLVEPEPGLLIENAEQFLQLAERVKSPMFGLNFDMGHFYCVSEEIPEAIQKLQSHIRHYHVEDIAASRVHEHLIPGDGAIDFTAALTAAQATGYAGWFTVELYPFLDDPGTAGRRALEHLLAAVRAE